MTIDTTTIKAGDKLHLRDGSVVVAWRHPYELRVFTQPLRAWQKNGVLGNGTSRPFDIIRIEPKPEPVVHEMWLFGQDTGELDWDVVEPHQVYPYSYKLTFTDGEPTVERVK